GKSGCPRWQVRGPSWRNSAGQDFGQSLAKVFEAFGSVSAALFGDRPSGVSNVIQSLHHRRPIVIALEQVDVEAFPETLVVTTLPAEFLDVQFLDSLSENSHPLLGPAVIDDVADIEMPANSRAVELIDIPRGFERAEQELIPNIL